MSFVPPPAGVAVPSDDWSDDPSFDLDISQPLHTRAHSPRSSNASISSSSSSRLSTSSPLRHVHTAPHQGLSRSDLKKRFQEEDDGLGDDFLDDEDEGFGTKAKVGPGKGTLKSAPKKMGTIGLTGTVIGMGPKGVGTITRLGAGASNASPILAGTVKARAKAIEKGWERDLDLDDLSGDLGGKPNMLELGNPPKSSGGITGKTGKAGMVLPPSNRTIAPADALDDLDFDDFGQEEEDQATLKAGATLKAMLPPPRSKPGDTTIKASKSLENDFDLESDLVLPLNMTNLTLVTQSQSQSHSRFRPTQHLRPRTSTSTIGTDWDSPSSGSSKKDSTSPSPWNKSGARQSETSGTSIDLEVGTPVRKGRAVEVEVEGEEEGEEMMLDLILPEPSFFAGMREGELNKTLDKKRKPQFGGIPGRGIGMGWHRPGEPQKVVKGDESMEDGLLFDDPGKELTGHRLRQQRKARGMGQGGARTLKGENTKGSWEKSREAGRGRHTPLPSLREKDRSTQTTIPALGHRSHSASASPHPGSALSSRDFSSASAMAGLSRRPESSHAITREENDREPPRTRTQSVMAPPPIPSTPSSRLRHQKSHYQLPPSPSPTLARKQSLASLQDALVHPVPPVEERRTETPQKERYHASTSRLTMATSSSRAKARPPISAIFPRSEIHTPSASTTSTSISGLSRGPVPRSGIPQAQSQMVYPLGGRRRAAEGKKRTWGDGTELEGIEDLEVDEPSNSRSSAASGSGIGLGRPSKKGDSLGKSSVPPRIEDKRKKSEGKGSVGKRKTRKTAGLIKHLGGVDKKKVVGDMTWNPSTLRWEGNESILRDFDSIPNPSARPALITHYTGGLSPSTNTASTSASASTIRIVGDMKFDPERMCWVSIGEEEPDPFADMADDEDEFGGTITRNMGKKLVSIGGSGALGFSAGSSRLASESSAGGSTWSWEERIKMRELDSPSSPNQEEITEELWRECKEAEERHKKEMKGWAGLAIKQGMSKEEVSQRDRREEKRLWEIRYLAMRS